MQKEIVLSAKSRGFHLVTQEVAQQLPELRDFHVGLAHIFIQHTSASLALNENADPTARRDMEAHFNRMVPENMPYYAHTYEGADDRFFIWVIIFPETDNTPISFRENEMGKLFKFHSLVEARL